jgi:hypothetical protein
MIGFFLVSKEVSEENASFDAMATASFYLVDKTDPDSKLPWKYNPQSSSIDFTKFFQFIQMDPIEREEVEDPASLRGGDTRLLQLTDQNVMLNYEVVQTEEGTNVDIGINFEEVPEGNYELTVGPVDVDSIEYVDDQGEKFYFEDNNRSVAIETYEKESVAEI